jgi:hypothetical protein
VLEGELQVAGYADDEDSEDDQRGQQEHQGAPTPPVEGVPVIELCIAIL